MQFSSDLPCGVRAVREHTASARSLTMNVSKDADRAFCLALKNSRRSNRWSNLENAMQRSFYRKQPKLA